MKTYKTNHPTIKEISIGDQFITYGGDIVIFTGLWNENNLNVSYPFYFCVVGIEIDLLYTINLNKNVYDVKNTMNIKSRYTSLKDKLKHL